MDHTNTNDITTEIIDGWVKTTETIVTWQEQPDQVAELLGSLEVVQAQEGAIRQKLSDLGYEG